MEYLMIAFDSLSASVAFTVKISMFAFPASSEKAINELELKSELAKTGYQTWQRRVISGLLEKWVIIIDISHSDGKCGLRNMGGVRRQDSQLVLLALFIVQLFLENHFSAEFVDGENRRGDVFEVGLVQRSGQETVRYGRIGVNIIRRHCRQNRPRFSS